MNRTLIAPLALMLSCASPELDAITSAELGDGGSEASGEGEPMTEDTHEEEVSESEPGADGYPDDVDCERLGGCAAGQRVACFNIRDGEQAPFRRAQTRTFQSRAYLSREIEESYTDGTSWRWTAVASGIDMALPGIHNTGQGHRSIVTQTCELKHNEVGGHFCEASLTVDTADLATAMVMVYRNTTRPPYVGYPGVRAVPPESNPYTSPRCWPFVACYNMAVTEVRSNAIGAPVGGFEPKVFLYYETAVAWKRGDIAPLATALKQIPKYGAWIGGAVEVVSFLWPDRLLPGSRHDSFSWKGQCKLGFVQADNES